MLQIDRPVLPPRLYRYRAVSLEEPTKNLVERELRTISENYLWCSHYKELNDPQEGMFGVSNWLTEQPTFEPLTQDIRDQRDKVGICCFADTSQSDLMWAHYAKDFSGICIAYSTKDLRSGLGKNVHFARVAYDEVPPRIGEEDVRSNLQAAIRTLSHKKACWQYEREWRLLTEPGTPSIPGPLTIVGMSPVKAVYFGYRMKRDIQYKLEQALTKMKIKIYTMKRLPYTYEWERL